jgi:hypothetical protein
VTTLIVKFLMKSAYLPISMMWIMLSLLPLLSPRIPPFVGYFLCRSSEDWLGLDICQLDDDGLFNIPRGNLIFNIFRLLGCFISLAVYTTSFCNVLLVGMYETFPSLIFLNDRLAQLQIVVRHYCIFSNHTQTILKYRELQILNVMFNRIYQRDLFALCMGTVLLMVIPNGYFIISMHQIPTLFLILGIYVTFIQYSVVLLIFSTASKVWINSREFVWGWNRNERLLNKTLTKKYGKSLQNLKVKIGSTNFVELNTPILLFSFCIEQTITLVLLNKP